MSICPVILAGGSGTRLWPYSRAAHPKQFLRLYGEDTMLQATLKRLLGLDIKGSITICNEEHRFFVAEQLREIDKQGSIILEPVGRNTAPAIALAALTVKDDPLLLVLPADHVIEDDAAFKEAVKRAIPLAEAGKLVTFGIVPSSPETGYGYIKRGKDIGESFEVDRFVEKPSLDVAQDYFLSGNYYWNSGMFLFRASNYLEELKKFRPDILNQCQASMMNVKTDIDFLRIDKDTFELCSDESIDYAVMEKTSHAVVVPMDAGWSDIGSWTALWEISDKDSCGNVGIGDVSLHETRNSYVRTENTLVTTAGIDDLVIISTKDAILVAHKDCVNETKHIVSDLKEVNRDEWKLHREVQRPWGSYDSIDQGNSHQVKRIIVKPGEKLSVQKHHHRSEHWIVVSGIAKVTNDNKTFILSENESTYIPAEIVHSLENPGKEDLHLIEVQYGSYLGEDDIVRFEDLYGRLEG